MRPQNLGLSDGRLKDCADRQNCVCSQSEPTQPSYVKPLTITKEVDSAQVIAEIKAIILALPRTALIKETQDYLWVEFKTRLGFIDDVEFYYQSDSRLIHFRSASRVGVYDLGKNRSRYKTIFKKLQKHFL